jgi:hypothetical protein
MIKIMLLALVMTGMVAKPVEAQGYPRSWYPVVADDGRQIGNVLSERKGDDIHLDFDFDAPYDCRLTSLSYDIRAHPNHFPRDGGGYFDAARYRYQQTYDKVRDAQVILDLPDRHSNQDVFISVRLWFWCDDVSTMKAAVEDGLGKRVHYFRYSVQPEPTPVPQKPVYRDYKPVDYEQKTTYYRDYNHWYPGYWEDRGARIPERTGDWYPGYWEERGAHVGGRSGEWYPGYWQDRGVEVPRRTVVILPYETRAQFQGPINRPDLYPEFYGQPSDTSGQWYWDQNVGQWRVR